MAGDQRVARQVGAALRRVREHRQCRQSRVAEVAGITRRQLAAYESGQQVPDLPTLRLLVLALGVTADDFGRHLGPWGCVEPESTFTAS